MKVGVLQFGGHLSSSHVLLQQFTIYNQIGNHAHGRPVYDPLFPTTKVPTSTIPRFPIDWRNGGRAMLCISMALLEGRRIRRHRKLLEWQQKGYCSSRCGETCGKSIWRPLCAWRLNGRHQHFMKMDAQVRSYKGEVKTDKPIFSTRRPQIHPNKYKSEGAVWNETLKSFVFPFRRSLDKNFGLFPHISTAAIREEPYGTRPAYDETVDEEADLVDKQHNLEDFLQPCFNIC